MTLFKKARPRRRLNVVRVVSAVMVLAFLVLVVAESAKYLYVARLPKSVSSRLEPSVDKLALVLGSAQSSLSSLDETGMKSSSEKSKVEAAGKETSESKEVAKIGLLADSHNDLEYLDKALTELSDLKVNQIIFLGDYTDWGELKDLQSSKDIMDKHGISYASLPGDHDLGETRDDSNFKKVFGDPFGILEIAGIKLLYFDNSKNYTVLDKASMDWFIKEVKDTNFLFLSQPLMSSSMNRVMGIVGGIKDESVYGQNIQLLETIRNSQVQVIISGDLHQFSQFKDPIDENLWHYSIGAVLKSQSLEKLNLQAPRFGVLTIKEDLSYKIDDISID